MITKSEKYATKLRRLFMIASIAQGISSNFISHCRSFALSMPFHWLSLKIDLPWAKTRVGRIQEREIRYLYMGMRKGGDRWGILDLWEWIRVRLESFVVVVRASEIEYHRLSLLASQRWSRAHLLEKTWFHYLVREWVRRGQSDLLVRNCWLLLWMDFHVCVVNWAPTWSSWIVESGWWSEAVYWSLW